MSNDVSRETYKVYKRVGISLAIVKFNVSRETTIEQMFHVKQNTPLTVSEVLAIKI